MQAARKSVTVIYRMVSEIPTSLVSHVLEIVFLLLLATMAQSTPTLYK
jgi:hypothetical protein